MWHTHDIIWYFSFSWLTSLSMISLVASMLLQTALVHSFYGWVVFHCVYVPHLYWTENFWPQNLYHSKIYITETLEQDLPSWSTHNAIKCGWMRILSFKVQSVCFCFEAFWKICSKKQVLFKSFCFFLKSIYFMQSLIKNYFLSWQAWRFRHRHISFILIYLTVTLLAKCNRKIAFSFGWP